MSNDIRYIVGSVLMEGFIGDQDKFIVDASRYLELVWFFIRGDI